MADGQNFRYRAVDQAGRHARGVIAAGDEATAFEQLRARGLSPLSLAATRKSSEGLPIRKVRAPTDRESAEFLSNLAELLRAGADIRTALSILGGGPGRPRVKALSSDLIARVSQGESVERAFSASFTGRRAFVPSMVAAGEMSGDLPSALQRTGEILAARLGLREQLVSVLAYPGFVFVSSIAALFVILLFIVPSIAPLAADAGTTPPPSLAILIGASDLLRGNLTALGVGLLIGAAGTALSWRVGVLKEPIERLTLDGPFRRTACAIVYGGFAVSLGTMLAAGASATDALRLSSQAVASGVARTRLEPVLQLVREGRALSASLETVRGFPVSIVRLALVGEATNALGQMLARGGRLEQETAMQRIQKVGRMSGPLLIIALGLLLGSLMGGLLSGVSQMGQAALG